MVEDNWIWSHCSSGIYTTKSAYSWLNEDDESITSQVDSWIWLWKMHIPANIQFFLWQVMHLAIPTKDILNHRDINLNLTCPICEVETETILHCLFSCIKARAIWNLVINPKFDLPVDSDLIPHWLHVNVKDFGVIIPITMWVLWCSRNAKIFEAKDTLLMAILNKIVVITRDTQNAFSKPPIMVANSQRHMISWQNGHVDQYILNVDGIALTNPGIAGFGGLIRDADGRFLRGFHGHIGFSNILHVEILALMHGIRMCWDDGLRKVICYTDSKNTIQLVQQVDVNLHHYGNEIAVIGQYMTNKEWNFQLYHTMREGNMCADYLAKLGAKSNSEPMKIVLEPPTELRSLIMADAMGVAYPRGC